MKLTGKIVDVSIDFATGKPRLTLLLNENSIFVQGYDDLKDLPKISVDLKPYRERRSLDANAYCWVLLDKIAEKTGIPKEVIYKESIKNIGGNNEVVCVTNEAVNKVRYGWERNGIGWQTDTFPSKLDGCTNVILYYGSSVYDSAQMSRLLDNIIQDCKALNIPTETPERIAEMKSLWGE